MKFARELIVPAGICVATFVVALTLATRAGISGNQILFDYFEIAAFTTLLAFLFCCLLPSLRPRELRQHSPMAAGISLLRDRGLLLLVPLFIFPVFMTGFTVSKTAFPHFVGFQWDGFWTVADAILLGGQDPWRLTHAWIGRQGTLFLSQCYTFLWGVILAIVPPLLLLGGQPGQGIRFYHAQMLMWFLGGVAGATLFSSVGPIFADLVDPVLGERFEPLRSSLALLLPEHHLMLQTQEYLRNSYGVPTAVRGAGISAMPSMHLGVVAMFVIVARGTIWFVPAVIFWMLIWVGSVHFGFHYAIDGIAGAVIAWFSWAWAAPRQRAPEPLPVKALALT
ncbi:MAG TPA: phosphatase PAP2 family protein [Sphingomicrobium sp.]|nr:phosphatase PAP2 family protein [Sphingomicrobium sp.]